MATKVEQTIAGIGIPILVGAGAGGLIFWMFNETVLEYAHKHEWLVPVTGVAIGAVTGIVLRQALAK
jgi:hypothetical protein